MYDVGIEAKELGDFARRLRSHASLTQVELAQRAGVSRSFMSDLERGHPGAELGKVLAVFGALGYKLLPATQALSEEPVTKEEFLAWSPGQDF